MRRTPAAPAMPPNNGPQSIGYDDSKWRGLDVPHDYVVEQLPDSSLEGNHGCRPKNVSWYRKNITITAVRMRVCYPRISCLLLSSYLSVRKHTTQSFLAMAVASNVSGDKMF